MNRPASLFLAALFSAALCTAHAHGDAKPRHGGIVEVSGEIKLELVLRDGNAEIYIDDHGQTVPTAGASGKLTVLSAGKKVEARLEPASGDRLVARGVKLGKGDKAIAVVTLPDKTNASVRFLIK